MKNQTFSEQEYKELTDVRILDIIAKNLTPEDFKAKFPNGLKDVRAEQ